MRLIDIPYHPEDLSTLNFNRFESSRGLWSKPPLPYTSLILSNRLIHVSKSLPREEQAFNVIRIGKVRLVSHLYGDGTIGKPWSRYSRHRHSLKIKLLSGASRPDIDNRSWHPSQLLRQLLSTPLSLGILLILCWRRIWLSLIALVLQRFGLRDGPLPER